MVSQNNSDPIHVEFFIKIFTFLNWVLVVSNKFLFSETISHLVAKIKKYEESRKKILFCQIILRRTNFIRFSKEQDVEEKKLCFESQFSGEKRMYFYFLICKTLFKNFCLLLEFHIQDRKLECKLRLWIYMGFNVLLVFFFGLSFVFRLEFNFRIFYDWHSFYFVLHLFFKKMLKKIQDYTALQEKLTILFTELEVEQNDFNSSPKWIKCLLLYEEFISLTKNDL